MWVEKKRWDGPERRLGRLLPYEDIRDERPSQPDTEKKQPGKSKENPDVLPWKPSAEDGGYLKRFVERQASWHSTLSHHIG